MSEESDLYFRQLPVGEMANFAYLIGSLSSREAMIVDPAWDVSSLIEVAENDGYTIKGALITHYHPDHIGGEMFGIEVEGIGRLLETHAVPLYVNKHEADGVKKVTGVSDSDLRKVDGGDTLLIGTKQTTFIHTPGHTPGSQCFLIEGHLVAGDTLFVQGCGRVDLPGSDPDQMYYSLTQKLAKLPPGTVLYPGHDYGPTPTSTIGDELLHNTYMRMETLADWQQMMGVSPG